MRLCYTNSTIGIQQNCKNNNNSILMREKTGQTNIKCKTSFHLPFFSQHGTRVHSVSSGPKCLSAQSMSPVLKYLVFNMASKSWLTSSSGAQPNNQQSSPTLSATWLHWTNRENTTVSNLMSLPGFSWVTFDHRNVCSSIEFL